MVLLALLAFLVVPSPEPRPLRLLVDTAHSNGRPGAGLNKTTFDYWSISNEDRMVRHLQAMGVRVDYLRQGEITSERLNRYDLLYVDLPRDEGQPLLDREIHATDAWVRRGGALMAVAEHTDAYHSYRPVNRLLNRFGVQVYNGTAYDTRNVFAFGGWQKLRNPISHPITRDVREVAMATGAPLISPEPLLTTSVDTIWDGPDYRNEGFTGDWTWTPGEPIGPAVVASAPSAGQGRVVVLGDRNVVGNQFLYYADNLRFTLQAWRWLARDRIRPRYRLDGATTVFILETGEPSDVMLPQSFSQGPCTRAWYNMYAALNRDARIIARCSDRLEAGADIVMLPPGPPLPSEQRARIGPDTVVVLLEDPEAGLSPRGAQMLGHHSVSLRRPIQEVTPLLWVFDARFFCNDAFRSLRGTPLGPGPIETDAAGWARYQLLWEWVCTH